MIFWLYCLNGILLIIIILLIIRIRLLEKSADEISDAFSDRRASDTNTSIDLSSRNIHIRNLANNINIELKKLQSDRLRYQHGDAELKNAVSGISHDLRTPLTAICGYLDMLEKEDQSDNAKRYLKIIRSRTEIMKQLTEELFHYSVFHTSTDHAAPEPVVLNHMLEESISAFYTALRDSHITPSVHMPDTKVIRTLNRSALSRIFGNIISNAVKYSDGDLKITLTERGTVTFANHACGLDEIQVGRLFDRFYTVQTAAAGSTGLGLSIARVLTEQMGGEISAEYVDGILSVRVHFPSHLL